MLIPKHIIFDWGDTLMRDDSTRDEPMYLWPEVHAIPGAEAVLKVLSQRSTLSVATSAAQSDAAMVRLALERVGLAPWITHIFTGRALEMQKVNPAFWRAIQHELDASPEDMLIVGDSFESDVITPAKAGYRAIWFNPTSTEKKCGERYSTIHRLEALIDEIAPDEASD